MIRAGSSTAAEPLRFRAMERSLRFVLLGTFTLRFSTGLTGAMLGLYLAELPDARRAGGRRPARRGVRRDVLSRRARPVADLRDPLGPDSAITA